MMKDKLVANHTSSLRRVRLNADFSVCDIFSLRRSTRDYDPDYPTSYQDPKEGFYEVTFFKESQKFAFRDLVGGYILEQEEIPTQLAKIPPAIITWLKDATTMKYSNFIPVGFGWDGKFSRAEYQKRQRAHLLFLPHGQGESNITLDWLDPVLDEICRTPKTYLTLNWNSAEVLPANRILDADNSQGRIELVFIDNQGNVTLQKTKRVIGAVEKFPGIKISDNVSRIIMLTRKVACDYEGNLIGISVNLMRGDW